MTFQKALIVAGLACAASTASPALAAAEQVKQDASTIAIPKPPQGKGQIVFFRKGGLSGSAVACSVYETGQKVSSLGGGRYFVMVADPGKHDFSVKTEATDTLGLEVEPDETQFVTCKIKMGLMVGRPDIRPVTEQEFRAAKSLKLVDADDMGPAPGALRPDELAAALAAPSAPSEPEVQPASEPAPVPAEPAAAAE